MSFGEHPNITAEMSSSGPTIEVRRPDIPESWLAAIGSEFEKPYMLDLKRFLLQEKQRGRVYPPGSMIFNALNFTPFDQVRVVVLGQDPYHGRGQAHGLSFSVQRGVRIPPSLENIYKEISQSLGLPIPSHGELTYWAQQGVLLLNTTLTVRERKPKSHAGQGWEILTDRIIDELNAQREGLVFLLWGRHAGKKSSRIDERKHLILTAPHPSPYSADSGFFGCNHFVLTNQHLESRGETPIDWRIL